MTRRDAPREVRSLADLSQLDSLVVDKRNAQRASAKRHRRNRHVEKQFIRHTLSHAGPGGHPVGDEPDELPLDEPHGH